MPNISHSPRHISPQSQRSSGQSDRELSERTYNELRTLASRLGINTHRMKKDELLAELARRI